MGLFSLSATLLLACRNTTNFCMLILYPETSLNLFMTSNSFLVVFRVFIYSIMSSANSYSFTFFLPIQVLFISCLISVARTSNNLLDKSDESGHLVFLILEEKLSVFTIEYDVSFGFVTFIFHYVQICSLYALFVRVFIMNGCCTLSNAFSASFEMIMIFILHLYLFFY